MGFKKIVVVFCSKIMAYGVLTTLLAGQANAETFPSKPIRLIVPLPGATDVICRTLAEKLRVSLGQPVILEIKAGAGTTVASAFVASAPADGHTLLCGVSAFLTAPHYFPEAHYDPVSDFAPVILLVKVAHTLLIRSDLPITNVRELIAYASANPNKLTFGSSGVGTSNYLGAALFQNMARVKMLNVPYKGGGPALQDLVGGQIDLLFDVPQGGLPFVKNGKLRALGVTTEDRLAAFPDWPTISESGVPGYASFPWAGILAPANTPPEIVKRLNQAVQEALNTPEIQARYKEMGLAISGGSPEQFSNFMEQESKKWKPLIERLKKDGL